MDKIPGIVVTADGSHTLRHPVTGDTYHSVNGAVAEAMHVFIRNGFETCEKKHVRILEAGFGSGLNALLTLRAAEESGRSIDYTAIELYPVTSEVVSRMTYADDPLFLRLHETPWGEPHEITPGFTLTKIHDNLANTRFDTIFDIVYYDAFAPDSQPELWTENIFRHIFAALAPGGMLLTYSAKGDVKRALRAAGFDVQRLKGAPGKRHMLRAVKHGG